MQNAHKIIAVLAVAALSTGCNAIPIPLPALFPSVTAAAPTFTPVLPSPTLTPGATYTPIVSTPTQPSPTFTAIATFTPTSSPSATVAPVVSPAPTLTFTPGPAGTSIGYADVTVLLPGSLGNDTINTTSTDVEFPYLNPSFGDMPSHVKLVISGYPIQGTALQPQIMVFPAAQYAQYTDYTRAIITTLQETTYYDGQPLPAGLPHGALSAHGQSVQFANGHGIRYLTQFDQAVLPINNRELIYYFNGLTDSGDFYVEAILPVTAAFLAADDDPGSPLPPGGIPFDMNNLGNYFEDVANKLNATPPNGFTPPFGTLDALIQSIHVGPVQ